MAKLREKMHLKQPPPMYKPVGVYLSVVVNYGGTFVQSPSAKYIGGNVMILDYVVAKQINLNSLNNSLAEWLLCDGEIKLYILSNNTFKLLSCDEEVREICLSSLGSRQVVFYINEGSVKQKNEVSVVKSTHVSENEGSDYEELCDCDYNMSEESDDDDILFDNNVSKDIDIESDGEESEQDDDVVHVDSNDFEELKESDDEQDDINYPIFNPEVVFEPEFELGMVFNSKDDFKLAVQSYAIKTKRSLKFTKTAPDRVYVRCDNDECKWRINLTKIKDEESFQIRLFASTHIEGCDPSYHVKNLKSRWLGKKFLNTFVSDRKRRVKVFRQDAIKELGCEISKEQAYRAKKFALKNLEGNPDEQYGKMWDYSEELRRTNPGSTVIIGSVDDELGQARFDRFYICLDAVKKGFKIGCRPIIGVDGCHLKGHHNGILLTAVGVDANNGIYPIAWAVVSRETMETWEWFLVVLKQDLELHVDSDYTFMSDKQKGLIQAMGDVFPNATHRFCVRHLHENFKLAGFRGLSFKNALWRAAQASTLGEWKLRMTELKNLNEAAWSWLDAKPPHQWSRSHFSEHSKCDMLLNNVCEAFNSTILDAREMPIITMLEWIREWIMVRFQRQRDLSAMKWKGKVCPRIKKIIEKNSERVGECIPIKGDNTHYEIKCHDGGQYLVDLDAYSCSCREWNLSGIPCKHAICAINHQMKKKEDYVHDCYTVETFRKTYAATIKGINGVQLWGESLYIPPLPPQMQHGKGKRTTARRKKSDEKAEIKLKKKQTKLKRRQKTLKCRKCGVQGHNSVTCGREQPNTASGSGSAGPIPQNQQEELSVGASMLPSQSSHQVYDEEEEQLDQALIHTQGSQIKSASVPGPSMYKQLMQDKFQRQGPLILESERKFTSIAELQATKKGRKEK